jgi:hypothetical protein
MHLANWHLICMKKDHGGLGIPNLKDPGSKGILGMRASPGGMFSKGSIAVEIIYSIQIVHMTPLLEKGDISCPSPEIWV